MEGKLTWEYSMQFVTLLGILMNLIFWVTIVTVTKSHALT
jgi:hypothetical protein